MLLGKQFKKKDGQIHSGLLELTKKEGILNMTIRGKPTRRKQSLWQLVVWFQMIFQEHRILGFQTALL